MADDGLSQLSNFYQLMNFERTKPSWLIIELRTKTQL